MLMMMIVITIMITIIFIIIIIIIIIIVIIIIILIIINHNLDRRTRKLLTINGGFHPRDCVGRLYAPRKDEERDLISVEDCVIQASISLESYVQSSGEELLKTVSREGVESQETAAVFKTRRRNENIQE